MAITNRRVPQILDAEDARFLKVFAIWLASIGAFALSAAAIAGAAIRIFGFVAGQ